MSSIQQKPTVAALQTTTIAGGSVGAGTNAGSKAALRSLEALQSAPAKDGLAQKARKGVVAALIGLTMMTAVAPTAHAQDVNIAPQGTELLLGHESTGPPAFTGFSDTFQGQRAGVDDSTLSNRQTFDRFLGAVPVAAPRAEQLAVDARSKAAFDAFAGSLAQIMHRDAASLAWGHTPTQFGDALTPQQEEQAQKALTNLLRELPVGAFGPGLENVLEKITGALGSNTDLATVRLKDVPREAGDALQDILKEMRKEHPGTFWTLASAVAGGALTLGYTEGTDALRDLGIRPEVSTRIFGDVKLRLGVDAGPKFSDPVGTFGLSTSHTFDNGAVWQGGVKARMGSQFEGGEFTTRYTTTTGFSGDGRLRLDADGPLDATLSVHQQLDRWSIGANANYTFADDHFTASLAAGRTFDINERNDLNLQFRASTDNHGESQVGFGMTFRW